MKPWNQPINQSTSNSNLNPIEIALDLVGTNKISAVSQIFVCLLFLWELLVKHVHTHNLSVAPCVCFCLIVLFWSELIVCVCVCVCVCVWSVRVCDAYECVSCLPHPECVFKCPHLCSSSRKWAGWHCRAENAFHIPLHLTHTHSLTHTHTHTHTVSSLYTHSNVFSTLCHLYTLSSCWHTERCVCVCVCVCVCSHQLSDLVVLSVETHSQWSGRPSPSLEEREGAAWSQNSLLLELERWETGRVPRCYSLPRPPCPWPGAAVWPMRAPAWRRPSAERAVV